MSKYLTSNGVTDNREVAIGEYVKVNLLITHYSLLNLSNYGSNSVDDNNPESAILEINNILAAAGIKMVASQDKTKLNKNNSGELVSVEIK